MALRRKKIKLRYKAERVLFSDVLPYELPVIFSNRYFYRFLLENGVKFKDGKLIFKDDICEGAKQILYLLFDCKSVAELESITPDGKKICRIPFTYHILHKPTKARALTVIHPANQIAVVDFYERYKSLILYYCNRDDFSIRHPKKVACYFYYRDKLHHQLLGRKADNLELFFNEYENLKSYFSYKKYTNIHKFYEDFRYQQAEKKFSYLLKFDVQSCFDSIYTHSIAWATNGGKEIYKRNFKGEDHTFGCEFDTMMQRMNYNETNGIVIGPEFSRIFSEIILQQIDCTVKRELQVAGYRMNVDYLCYRYVDDYFFFYNDDKVKEKALLLFDREMKEYKLSISDTKTKNFERPFITEITIAKQGIDGLITEYLSFRDDVISVEMTEPTDFDDQNSENTDISQDKINDALNNGVNLFFKSNRFIAKYKAIIKDAGVENKDVVNYALAKIEHKLQSVLKKFDVIFKHLSMGVNNQIRAEECNLMKKKMERMLSEYLIQITDVSFFLYADCKRINTTLKLMQILNDIIIYLDNDYHPKKDEIIKRFTNVIRDNVFKNIQKEVDTVFRISSYQEETPLETLYLLVTIKSLRDKYRINQDVIDKYLGIKYDDNEEANVWPRMNALVIILLLYYYGASDKYLKQRKGLVKIIQEKYKNEPSETRMKNAELVILLLDLLACPYFRSGDRRAICSLMGITRTKQPIVEKYIKARRFMFTRWTNVNLTKELGAKVSLEVYS